MTNENQTPPYAPFAARFMELLEVKANGNRSECARAMDCTPQAVSKWASGTQIPRGDQMDKLAAWLGTTPGYLRYGEGDRPEPVGPKLILMFVEGTIEAQLLNDFRLGTDRGKMQVLAAARRMEKIPADEWPAIPSTDH